MAFNSSDDIDIRIRVSADGVVRVLNQVGDEIEKIDEAAKEASSGFTAFQAKLVSAESALSLLEKAGRLAGQALSGIVKSIQGGAAFNDIADSFKALAESAGTSSDVLLRDLRSAVAGTISDFELMKRSAELARAGLDPRDFAQLAQASRNLADQVGGETTEAFDQLSQALVRGRVVQLRDFGIIIDQQKAYDDFAKSIGTTADKLNELGQAEAGRIAIMEAITERNREMGQAAIDSGDAIDQMNVSLENSWTQFISTISANKSFNELLKELTQLVSSIDFTPLISALNAIVTVANEAALALGKVAQAVQFVGNLGAAISGDARGLIGQLGLSSDEVAEAQEALAKVNQEIQETGKTQQSAVKDGKQFISTLKGESEAAKKLEEAHKNLNKAIMAATGTDGIPELDANLRKLVLDLRTGVITVAEFNKQVNSIGKGASAGGLSTIASELGSVAREIGPEMTTSIEEIFDPANYEDAYSKYSKWLEGKGSETVKSYGEQITDGFKDVFGEDLGPALEDTLAGSIGDSLSAALNGGDWKEIGKDFAKNVGRDLGEAFGGQIGGEIGAALGEAVFKGLDHVFGGGKDPGAKARKSIDAWFAEMFDANRLTVIVGGELQKIKDLVFSASGDSSEFESGTFDDAFATLPAAAMEAFNGVGAAYEALLDEMGINTEEISGQLAAILFNNIGGSISDLRLLIEATGQSAEAMADALIQAFLEGSMSALELARNLRGLEQTLQKGIPEGLGRVDIAWQRVIDAGFEGGRALFDAIVSVAIEAQELGASTMPDLANIMINTFGIAADQVAVFMQAMAAAGIDSLAALASASNETLAAIAGNMQAIQTGQPDRFKPAQISRPSGSFGGGGGGRSSGASRAELDADRAKEDKRAKFNEIRDLILGTDKYTEALEQLNAGLTTKAAIDKLYNELQREAIRLTNQLEAANKKAETQIDKNGKVSAKTAREIAQLQKRLEELGATIEQDVNSALESFSVNDELLDFIGKFKDDLNALQLAADAAGVSFADLQKEAIAAFKAGNLTATEALNQLMGGVDGSNDVTVDALKRLKQGAGGGALTIDALRDFGANLLRGGATSFEDIIDAMEANGFSVRDIQNFIISLNETGIDSLKELSDVSDQKAIEIIASMEKLGFNFDAVTDKTKKLLEELSQIPTSKTIEIDIKTIIDPETKKILKALGILDKLTKQGASSYGTNSPGLG